MGKDDDFLGFKQIYSKATTLFNFDVFICLFVLKSRKKMALLILIDTDRIYESLKVLKV